MMVLKSVRGFALAFSLASAGFSFQSQAAVEEGIEGNQLVSDSALVRVDYEVTVLTPSEAQAFMKERNISDESLEQQGQALAIATADAGDSPFSFLGRIFGSQNQAYQTQGYRSGRHSRRERRGERRSYSGSCEARSGVASYYGSELAGHRTASGSRFNPNAMTAAHRTLPFGTLVRVIHGGRSVVVTITDRGPFVAGRVIDLSRAAAQSLGISTGYVSLQILNCG